MVETILNCVVICAAAQDAVDLTPLDVMEGTRILAVLKCPAHFTIFHLRCVLMPIISRYVLCVPIYHATAATAYARHSVMPTTLKPPCSCHHHSCRAIM
jgi:hypothetical protein